MRTVTIENLSGGMTSDIRDESSGVVKLAQHFDILTKPYSLTPYHSQITGDVSAATNKLTDFTWDPTNGAIVARGLDGSGHAKAMTKSDFTSANWGTTANYSGTKVPIDGVWVLYHNAWYGMYNGGKIYKYDPNTTWSDDTVPGSVGGSTWGDATHPNGIVHSKDDILYMAQNNIVASNNNGTWTNPALTLPSTYIITAMCEYGDYLAIACSTNINGYLPGVGKSVVFLWDRDTTLNTVSEVIDFGYGELKVLEQVEGVLIGVSLRQDVFDNLGSRFTFREYVGGVATVIKELVASSTTGLQLIRGQKFNANRLYFLGAIEIDGTLRSGVWGFGKGANGRWSVWLDRTPNNDTVIGAGALKGFFMFGDYALISYNDGGYKLTMTDSTTTSYNTSSIIETTINPGITGSALAERTANKQLHTIAVSYAPLTIGQQVKVEWQVDGGGWNTARTETTVGRVVSEIPQAEGNYETGREYQFRLTSTGGAVLTGFKYKYEVQQTLI